MSEILIAILAKDKAICLPFYLKCIYNQTYDKKKIHLYIRTNDNKDSTVEILANFIEKHRQEYASVFYDDTSVSESIKAYGHHEWNSERFTILGKIRQDSIEYAKARNLHYFTADCDNFIVPQTIERMFQLSHLGVIAPMLKMYPLKNPHTDCIYNNKWYSNFHYDVDDNGYYKKHDNYYHMIDDKLKGIVCVKCVHCTYFISNKYLQYASYMDKTSRHEYVIFSDQLRKNNVSQCIDNTFSYGFLTFAESKEHYELEYNYWTNCIDFNFLHTTGESN